MDGDQPQHDAHQDAIDPVLLKLLEAGDTAQKEWISTTRYTNPQLIAEFCALRPDEPEFVKKIIECIYAPPLPLNWLSGIDLDLVAIRCLEAFGADPKFAEFMEPFGTIQRIRSKLPRVTTYHGQTTPERDALLTFISKHPKFFISYLWDWLFELDEYKDVEWLEVEGLPFSKKMILVKRFYYANSDSPRNKIFYTKGLNQEELDELATFLLQTSDMKNWCPEYLGWFFYHLGGASPHLKEQIVQATNLVMTTDWWRIAPDRTIPLIYEAMGSKMTKQTILDVEQSRIRRLIQNLSSMELTEFLEPDAVPVVLDLARQEGMQDWFFKFLNDEQKNKLVVDKYEEFEARDWEGKNPSNYPREWMLEDLEKTSPEQVHEFLSRVSQLDPEDSPDQVFQTWSQTFMPAWNTPDFTKNQWDYIWSIMPALNPEEYFFSYEGAFSNLQKLDMFEKIVPYFEEWASHWCPLAEYHYPKQFRYDFTQLFLTNEVPEDIFALFISEIAKYIPHVDKSLLIQGESDVVDRILDQLNKQPPLTYLEAKYGEQLEQENMTVMSPYVPETGLFWMIHLLIPPDLEKKFINQLFMGPKNEPRDILIRALLHYHHSTLNLGYLLFKVTKYLKKKVLNMKSPQDHDRWQFIAKYLWLPIFRTLPEDQQLSEVCKLAENPDPNLILYSPYFHLLEETRIKLPEQTQFILIKKKLELMTIPAIAKQIGPACLTQADLTVEHTRHLMGLLGEGPKRYFLEEVIRRIRTKGIRRICTNRMKDPGERLMLIMNRDRIKDFVELLPSPDLVVLVVIKNLAYLEHLPSREDESAEPLILEEKSQVLLAAALKKKYSGNRSWNMELYLKVFALLNPTNKQALVDFMFENLTNKQIDGNEMVPMINHVPYYHLEKMMPLVPHASTDFFLALDVTDSNFILVFMLLEIRGLFGIPSDIIKIILGMIQHRDQRFYLQRIMDKLSSPSLSLHHFEKYLYPFFKKSHEGLPFEVNTRATHLIAQKILVPKFKERVKKFIYRSQLKYLLPAYLSHEQQAGKPKEILQKAIRRRLEELGTFIPVAVLMEKKGQDMQDMVRLNLYPTESTQSESVDQVSLEQFDFVLKEREEWDWLITHHTLDAEEEDESE